MLTTPPVNCVATIEYTPWSTQILYRIAPLNDANNNTTSTLGIFTASDLKNSTVPDPECLMQESLEKGLPLAKKLALVVGVVAVMANLLSLLAILNINKKLTANLRLILSLCLSDTLVAVSVITISSNNELVPFGEDSVTTCVEGMLRAIRMTAHIASLFNLLGLGMDHYYAIVKTLHYRMVMSKKKVTWAIVVSWILSFILGSTDFFMPSEMFQFCEDNQHNMCSRAACTTYDTKMLVFSLTVVTLFLLLVLYISIFLALRRKHTELHRHKVVMKSKKQGIITTLFILGTFILFWLPYCLFESSYLIIGTMDMNDSDLFRRVKEHTRGSYYLYCVLLLNSLSDPVIYAWRMREVQRGYRRLIAKITCLRYKYSRSTATRITRHHSLDSLLQLKLKRESGADFAKYPCRYYSQYNTNALPINGLTCSHRYPSPKDLLRTNGYIPLETADPSDEQTRPSSLTNIYTQKNYWDKVVSSTHRKSCCAEMLRYTHRFSLRDIEIVRRRSHYYEDSQDTAYDDTLEEEHSLCSTPPSSHHQHDFIDLPHNDQPSQPNLNSPHSDDFARCPVNVSNQSSNQCLQALLPGHYSNHEEPLQSKDYTVTDTDTQCLISYIDVVTSKSGSAHRQDSMREHSKSHSDLLSTRDSKLTPSSQQNNQQMSSFSSDSKISCLSHRNPPI